MASKKQLEDLIDENDIQVLDGGAEDESPAIDLSKPLSPNQPITVDGQTLPQDPNALWIPTEVAPPAFDPQAEMNKQLSSTAGAFGRGAAQSALLGFPDELTAAVESGALSGPEFEKILAESRENYKTAQTEHPMAYGAGTVAGIAAPAALTLGAGAVPAAGRAAMAPASTLLRSLQAAEAAPTVGRALAGTGAGLADASLMSGIASAGFSEEDKGEAFTEGATDPKTLAIAGLLSGAANSYPLLSKLAKQGGESLVENVPLAKSVKEAYNIKKNTGQDVIGIDASKRALAQTDELATDIDKAMRSGLTKEESKFKSQLDQVSKEAVKLQQKSKNEVGARIGNTVQSIVESGEPAQVSGVVDDIIADINSKVEAGVIEEGKVKGLLTQLNKLKETPAGKPISLKETRTLSKLPGDEDFGLTQSSAKVGGKEVSLEELLGLKKQADQVKNKSSSLEAITQVEGPEFLKQVSNQELSQAAIPRESVDPGELVKLRNLMKTGMESSDPALSGLYRRSHAKLTENLASMLPEEAQAQFAGDRSKYQNLLELEDLISTKDFKNKAQPSNRFLSQLEATPDVQSTAQSLEMERVFKLLEDTSPELVQGLRQKAASSAEGLAEVQGLMKKYFPSLPGPEGSRVRPGIERGIGGLHQSYVGKPERSGEELLGAIERSAAPEEAAKLKARSTEVAKMRDLAGLSRQEDPTFASNKMQAIKATLLGVGKSAFIRGGQYAGAAARGAEEMRTAINNAPAQVLTKLTQPQIQFLADKLYQGGKLTTSAAVRGLLDKDLVGRNAAIFMISQNPKIKEDLADVVLEDVSDSIGEDEIEEVNENK